MDDAKTQGTAVQSEPPSPAGEHLLRIIGGPDAGKWIPVSTTPIVIGTAPTAGLRLSDSMVSRTHLEARWTGGGLSVRDLGSSNGTFFLGSRITEAILPPGGVLALGETRIVLLPAVDRAELPAWESDTFGALVGRSAAMRRLFTAVDRIAPSDVTVLLTGETGTGKDLLARELHARSERADRPFVVVDCAAVAPTLVESELFGHEKGAFTGAIGRHEGAFEAAHGGTVFLDEVGELPIALQPKLLRVLEDRTVQRVGATERIPVDVRFVAATHRDLAEQVKKETFRADLFYRLAVAVLRVPPLRERPEDVPLLVQSLVDRAPEGRRIAPTAETIALLARHDWPGNVRELRNFVERALAFRDPRLLEVGISLEGAADEVRVQGHFEDLPFKEAKRRVVEAFEREYLRALLERYDHNYSQAAKKAGIDRNHLAELAERYGLAR